MAKLRARGALRRGAAGEGTDFVVAADVDNRALEDRVYREAIDHGLDLAIVERAAIAREEIVDRCTIFEVAFTHSPSPWPGLVRTKPSAECRNVTLFHSRVEPRAVTHLHTLQKRLATIARCDKACRAQRKRVNFRCEPILPLGAKSARRSLVESVC